MKLSGVIIFFRKRGKSLKWNLVLVVVRLVLDQSLKASCHCGERQKETSLNHWKNPEAIFDFGFICKEADVSNYCPSSECI